MTAWTRSGGAEAWDRRGEFQLQLLQQEGLEPQHRLLDVGCGPLRAGRFFIRYLEPEHYCGVDYHSGFIQAAEHVIRASSLSERKPSLHIVSDFDLTEVAGAFDFVLAFSVLNHCDPEQRQAFFRNVSPRLSRSGRIYITHARWFEPELLRGQGLNLARVLHPEDASPIQEWGWEQPDEIFPILELVRGGTR